MGNCYVSGNLRKQWLNGMGFALGMMKMFLNKLEVEVAQQGECNKCN